MDIQNEINITVQERMDHYEEQTWPDFRRMALELSYLDELSDRGWWANWGGCMYAETVIRAFGGIVADAALACEQGDEGASETTTVALLDRVDAYLHWQGCAARTASLDGNKPSPSPAPSIPGILEMFRQGTRSPPFFS